MATCHTCHDIVSAHYTACNKAHHSLRHNNVVTFLPAAQRAQHPCEHMSLLSASTGLYAWRQAAHASSFSLPPTTITITHVDCNSIISNVQSLIVHCNPIIGNVQSLPCIVTHSSMKCNHCRYCNPIINNVQSLSCFVTHSSITCNQCRALKPNHQSRTITVVHCDPLINNMQSPPCIVTKSSITYNYCRAL